MVETLGTIAAIMTTVSFLPQAIKTIRTRDVSGISLGMYTMLLLGCGLWTVYGLLKALPPVWLANVVTGLFVLIIFVIKLQDHLKGHS